MKGTSLWKRLRKPFRSSKPVEVKCDILVRPGSKEYWISLISSEYFLNPAHLTFDRPKPHKTFLEIEAWSALCKKPRKLYALLPAKVVLETYWCFQENQRIQTSEVHCRLRAKHEASDKWFYVYPPYYYRIAVRSRLRAARDALEADCKQ